MSFLSAPDELHRFVNAQTLARGLQLQRSGQVLEVVLHEDEEDGLRLWSLEGLVQGSLKQPYRVNADLSFEEDGRLNSFEGDCSCPVGVDCKHAVALALQAGVQNAAQTSPPAAPAHQWQSKAPTLPPAQQQVEQWLQRVDMQRELERKAQADPGGSAQEQPVYLLRSAKLASKGQQPALPGLELAWRTAHPLKRGGWSKPRQPGYDMDQRIGAQSLTGQALQLMRALDSVSGYSYYISDWKRVHGQLGLLALQACARTGRLFLANETGAIASEPLAWGEARMLAWSWQPLPAKTGQEALWQLRTGLDEQIRLFAAAPVLYLDTALNTCGAVQAAGVEDAHLPLLLAAPPLPASSFAAPSPRLLRQLAPLPWPPGVQAPAQWPSGQPVAATVAAGFAGEGGAGGGDAVL